jgi:fibronectin-binding autotransporter adhesin
VNHRLNTPVDGSTPKIAYSNHYQMRLKQPKRTVAILFVMANTFLAGHGFAQRISLGVRERWLREGNWAAELPDSITGPSLTLWTGTTGSWFNAGNWSAGVPAAMTDVQINNGGTAHAGAPSDFLTAHNVILGFGSSDSGNLSVLNGLFEGTGSITVGRAGTGTVSFDNADLRTQSGVIGELSGSEGVVSIARTIWTNTGDVIVGQSGTGTLEMLEGTLSSANGVVGEIAGSVGIVSMDGGAFPSGWGTANLSIGKQGNGTVNLGHADISAATIFIGQSAGSHGTVLADFAATITSAGNIYLGGNENGPGGTGLLRLVDSAKLSASTTVVWNTGTLEIKGTPRLMSGFNFVGGTLRTIGNSVFTSNATLGNGGVILDSNGFNSTLSGTWSGMGGLTKINAGSVTMSVANTYTGPTTVNAGELIVNNTIASNVTVDGGTLSGSGSTGSLTVHDGGTVAPGNSPGILGVVGDLTLAMGSTFLVDLNGTAVGKQYDQLQVMGSVSLDDATLSLNLGFVSVPGTMFTIISNDLVDSITGTFAALPEGAKFTSAGQTFTITYHGGDGNDVALQTIVPEPETWALISAGATLLIVSGRRRAARV